MTTEPATDDYAYIVEALQSGDIATLEEIAQIEANFPQGKDPVTGRAWVINAIDLGSIEAIEWMLSQGVKLNFVDEEGYSPVLSAIDRTKADRYKVLRLLLEHNADPNLQGINDWSATHLAAARDDVPALELLVKYGADLTIRTRIDDYNTPLEEARLLKKRNAIKFLAQFE